MRCAWGVLALAMVTGCTGKPSSTSSWQSSTDRTLGTVIAGLGTARLVVEQESRDKIPHAYSVVAVTDAIGTSSREISSYLVGQPPDDLHAANAKVTAALQAAAELLVEVRVEIASPGIDRGGAQRLVDRIDAMRDRLDELDTAVMRSPASVGRP